MEKEYLGYKKYVWFMGVVEDINDPLSLSRVKVRMVSLHSEIKEILPTEELHWAIVSMPTTSASTSGIGHSPSGLVQGSWVWGFFLDGEDAQQPMVCGSWHGIPEPGGDPNLGFNDPDGEFPRYTDEPDTNKLSRGENTIEDYVDDKINNPPSQYAATYPNNKVIETTSGHIIEVDDTPGVERIRVFHTSNTFIEMHPNGDVVQYGANNNFRVVTSNDSLRVKGNVTVFVDGNADMTVTGNVTQTVEEGSVTQTVAQGNVTQDITVGNVTQTVGGNVDQTVSGALTLDISKNATVTVPTTNWTGNINLTGDINITGTSTASGDHVSAGISGKGHTHTDTAGLGAGTTSTPQ